jgi:hypothetical protein
MSAVKQGKDCEKAGGKDLKRIVKTNRKKRLKKLKKGRKKTEEGRSKTRKGLKRDCGKTSE